ncbi:leucine-rich repeat-containing protein, putative [Pediculus humanus corporis]|uniref:Leucine-rich repeat-containing protein 51 n=1 Tax=Pediculus humanus subsp. corporis TaxID=121224 RepID=E0VSX0_PEDHC|nr:leucine-rich repeat-containing protein, putative [Pediculus humanus corporis]EEB16476.1 leucine-rich repeat-containing protein, putative [Pediculus humanus corporis]
MHPIDKPSFFNKSEKILKEIYAQVNNKKKRGTSPEPRKKSKLPLTNSRIDPNVQGVPLDYSFRKADTLEELKNDTPREYRVGVPKKTSSGKFISSSLWVNYNNLTDLRSIHSLVKVSFSKPEMIGWLDVSFNSIEIISNDLLQLKNLKILYLHGNQIKFFIEVTKLKSLKLLKTLTLHGNPIEENPIYRSTVIKTLPNLINFDFSVVTK